MYNKIILAGNLTRDIELRYSQSGSAIANTAIATSRKFTSNGEKKEEVCFVDIIFFGKSAEVANQYLRKGSKILVEGRLKFDQWQDQQGKKRSKHCVNVESMQMLDSKRDSQTNQGYKQQPQQGNCNQQAPQQQYQQPQQQAPQQTYQAPHGNVPVYNESAPQNQQQSRPRQ